MNTASLEALVKIFEGVGADTKEILIVFFTYKAIKFLIGIGVVIFLIKKITGILCEVINTATLAKGFQRDVDGYGLLTPSERRRILDVWQRKLEKKPNG